MLLQVSSKVCPITVISADKRFSSTVYAMLPSACCSQRQLPLCQPSTSAPVVPRRESSAFVGHPRSRHLLSTRCPRVLVRADQATKESTNQTTNPAETTEKFGLEAGLWQVFRTKNANGVSRTDQAKDLLKTYGSAYLLTSISFAIVSFAACYALVSAGPWPCLSLICCSAVAMDARSRF
eukprot:jgi/Botrbrau1/21716/Bobra.43_1s0111.2